MTNSRKKAFTKTNFFISLISAATLALSITTISAAYASVIYTGKLQNFLPLGTACIFLGAIFLLFTTSIFSELPLAIGRPQDEPLPIFILMSGSITATITDPQTLLPTILIAILLTTCFTGIFLFFIGKFNLGNLIRFIPFPVVAGFIAGVGWILIVIAFNESVHIHKYSFDTIVKLFDGDSLIKWLPMLIFGLITFTTTKLTKHPLAIPMLIVSGVLIFYFVVFSLHLPISTLRKNGLLFASITTADTLTMLSTISFKHVGWLVLLKQTGQMCLIAIISALSLLFIASSLELVLKKEVDLNHELQAAGIGNMIAGLCFCTVGYIGLAHTILNKELKSNNRSIGFLCGIFCLIILLLGGNIISYLPLLILNGLLLFLGLALLSSWTFDLKKKLSPLDMCIIFVIFLTVITVGTIEGIIIGIILSIIIFVINYSRLSPIKFIFTGTDLHSNRQWTPTAQKIIAQHGNDMLYFKLQNFLFFGSANAISETLKKRLSINKHIKFLIYDFELVSGMDSSINLSFEKIKQYAQKIHATIIFTGLTGKLYNIMRKNEIIDKGNPNFIVIFDHDKALQWYEKSILAAANYSTKQTILLKNWLTASLNPEIVDKIAVYFHKLDLNKDEYLLHQGDDSHTLYYLESGQLTVFISETDSCKIKRLATIGAGNVVGEISLYLQSTRTASIVAEENCQLRYLTYENFKKMQKENPKAAGYFHKIIVNILAKKLVRTNNELTLLLK